MAGTPLLEHLDITACANYSDDLVTDVVLAHPNVVNFKSLHISGLPGVDMAVVDRISEGLCPALTAFSIGYCETLPAACIERVVAAYPQMEHFGTLCAWVSVGMGCRAAWESTMLNCIFRGALVAGIHWIASVDDAIVQKIAAGEGVV